VRNVLEQFATQLLKEKSLPPNLQPAVYEQMVRDLSERANDLINRRLIDAMTEEQADRFDQLLQTNPDVRAVQAFIEASVPNRDLVVSSALIEFRNLYLGTH
jgi:hypothetical protein